MRKGDQSDKDIQSYGRGGDEGSLMKGLHEQPLKWAPMVCARPASSPPFFGDSYLGLGNHPHKLNMLI